MPTPPDPSGGYGSIDTQLGTATGSSNNSLESTWGLGNLYGEPVVMGMENTPAPAKIDPTTGRPLTGSVTQKLDYGNTQKIVEGLTSLWAQQEQDRQQDPHGLTQYEQYQQLLWQAGFYGQTSLDKIHLGQWDQQTFNAIKGALDQYEKARLSGEPVTWTEFLKTNAQAAQSAQGGFYGAAGATSAKQTAVTDPASIRQAVQSAAMNALGRGLTEDQLNAFVSKFQQEQQSAELSTASNVTQPDLSAQAAAYAQSAAPADFSSYQDDKYMNALMNMFLPSASSRPNLGQITPRVSA